ncbi:MAG: anti-virulence regulator CigR family protein [Alcaligenaceae bacterium]|nr:anti-virulence regulator CigR family protein [Alcaligenaceae bacterium]
MRAGIAVTASLIAACSLAFSAQAAPPEGKGPGNNAGKGNPQASANQGRGNSGNSGKGNFNPGNSAKGNSSKAVSGPGNSDKGRPEVRGNINNNSNVGRGEASNRGDNFDRRYDARGRYYDYFDDRRDSSGRLRSGSLVGDLVYAGITAALARDYASDVGLRGYSTLPPGIRKNLARGKPLPPGIAKKMVPGSLLDRLPRHSGYEWRVAGSDLVLISVATDIVADILYDVFN